MKRICKHLIIPIDLIYKGLEPLEIWVLANIDSLNDGNGISLGNTAIASACGMTVKEIKPLMKQLHSKGAIDLTIDENGTKIIKPLMFKDSYKQHSTHITGDKPKNTETIDFDYIQEQWNTINPKLTPLSRMTTVRKRKIRAALNGCDCSVGDLIKAFKIVSSVPFLQGTGINATWKADFDWVVGKPQTLTRILEGVYSKNPSERLQYETIMRGGEINSVSDQYYDDDVYR